MNSVCIRLLFSPQLIVEGTTIIIMISNSFENPIPKVITVLYMHASPSL